MYWTVEVVGMVRASAEDAPCQKNGLPLWWVGGGWASWGVGGWGGRLGRQARAMAGMADGWWAGHVGLPIVLLLKAVHCHDSY